MATSATTTYFQGGDYVELLSAQGKAPAAAWRVQGKILKSFEKSIRGNAFTLDGSAETKMQLPKTLAPTTHSLGLTQRFAVFQLAIPMTRSFAIELGFSDFQKIRRRFVVASAFRDTATTSLHVQIPLDTRVSRDQWLNLVFDLQALTETYFSGSTFRSIESICISGSCKLKRVFTMKDAPMTTQRRDGSVARYAEMRDIPKQFVFASSAGAGPIPTEYFVTSSASTAAVSDVSAAGLNSNSNNCSSAGASRAGGSAGRTKSAPSAAATGASSRQRTTGSSKAAKESSVRPVSRSTRAVVEAPAVRSELGGRRSPLPPTAETTPAKSSRPLSATPSLSLVAASPHSPDRPNTARSTRSARDTTRQSASEASRDNIGVVTQPRSSNISRSNRSVAIDRSTDREALRPPSRSPTTHTASASDDDDDDDDENPWSRPETMRNSQSSLVTRMSTRTMQLEHDDDDSTSSSAVAAVRTNKELHRRAIIAEIQAKLDSLSDDDEHEAQRNSRLFLQHTSILAPTSAMLDLNSDTDDQAAPAARMSSRSSTTWRDDSNVRSSKPSALATAASTRPHKSIFSFARPSSDAGVAADACVAGVRSTTSLFDFDSLLDATPSRVTASPVQVAVGTLNALPPFASVHSSRIDSDDRASSSPRQHTPAGVVPADIQNSGLRRASHIGIGSDDSDDDDDRALAELLIAKRNARRDALERVRLDAADNVQQRTSHETNDDAASGSMQLKLSLEDLVTTSTNDAYVKPELSSDSMIEQVDEHALESRAELAASKHDAALTAAAAPALASDAHDSGVNHIDEEDDNNDNNDNGDEDEDNGDEDNGDGDEDEDDNLSIDLTNDLTGDADDRASTTSRDDAREQEATKTSDDNVHVGARDNPDDGAASDEDLRDSDSATSFDFDDLVENKATAAEEQLSPPSEMGDEDKAAEAQDQDDPLVESPVNKPPRRASARMARDDEPLHSDSGNSSTRATSSSQGTRKSADRLAFSTSPARQRASPREPRRRSSRSGGQNNSEPPLSFSSSRRLASLLESTDWSDFGAHAGPVAQPTTAKSKRTTSTTKSVRNSTASLELIYDPLLKCYYDPVANKYYALATSE